MGGHGEWYHGLRADRKLRGEELAYCVAGGARFPQRLCVGGTPAARTVVVAHNPLDGSEWGMGVRGCHVSLRDSVVINRGELVVLLINVLRH